MTKRRSRWLKPSAVAILLVALLPVAMVLPWRWIPPPTSAFMLRAGLGGQEVQQRWVGWTDMSPHLPIAVVAAEDQRFPHHNGFDFDSIRSALDQQSARQRGASTITQQVAKNLFLWPERSWIRKGVEAYLTLLIEVLWPKQRILEIYLNIAELGPGVFGVEAAADRFFGTTAAGVNRRQAALLAAVLPSPKRFSAADPSPYVSERADWIERQVRQLGGPGYLEDL